jgi:hypothetical protein
MANSIYAIPIRMLFDERNDPHMGSFIADLNINLIDYNDSQYPTVSDFKFAIKNCGFLINHEQFQNFQGEQGWSCGINESEGFNTPISIDNVITEEEQINKMISFPRGNWETVIKILVELVKNSNDILFYCDSGQMSLISKTKTVEMILDEFK